MYREKKKKGKLYKFDSVTHLAYRFGKPKNQWFSWTLTHCHRPRTCQHWVYCSATRIPNRRRRPALFWRPLPWYNRTGQLTLGVTNTNLLTYLLVLAAIMCNGRWRCSRPELTLRQSPLDQTHRCLASMTRQNFKAESFSSQAVGTSVIPMRQVHWDCYLYLLLPDRSDLIVFQNQCQFAGWLIMFVFLKM